MTYGSATPPAPPPAPAAPERLPDGVIDEAITWSVKLDYNHATPATRRAFERWLEADPLHARAWARVAALRGDFAALPPRLALEALQVADHRRRARSHGRRKALKLLSLAGIGLATGWLARDHAPWQRLLADASTATGEQRTLRLSDGTVIVLNTDSAVSTDLTGDRRLVILHRGEILVTTGSDAGAPTRRPFWVYTPFGRMRALGTRFVARLDRERARISVQEGAVELHPAGGGELAVVRAGEARWLADDGSAPAEAHGFDEDAWADGVIAGRNIRMGDLVAELARYRRGRIVCEEGVAGLRVSGVFHVTNTDQALQFLAQTQPVSVRYRTRFWVVVGPPAGS